MADQPDKEQIDPLHELALGLTPVVHHLDEVGHAIGEVVLSAQESHEVVEAHADSHQDHYVQAHDDAPTTIDAVDYHVSPAEHDLPTEA